MLPQGLAEYAQEDVLGSKKVNRLNIAVNDSFLCKDMLIPEEMNVLNDLLACYQFHSHNLVCSNSFDYVMRRDEPENVMTK